VGGGGGGGWGGWGGGGGGRQKKIQSYALREKNFTLPDKEGPASQTGAKRGEGGFGKLVFRVDKIGEGVCSDCGCRPVSMMKR